MSIRNRKIEVLREILREYEEDDKTLKTVMEANYRLSEENEILRNTIRKLQKPKSAP